jgi:putative endonuclease
VTGSDAGKAVGSGKAVGARRKALGKAGEDLATAWYEARGYEVLARNWSCRDGELDIVLGHGRLHVFCEVKARGSGAFGLPAEAVGPLKQARVRRLAALWFAQLSRGDGEVGDGGAARSGGPVRFDVASVLDGEVEVIEGAF